MGLSRQTPMQSIPLLLASLTLTSDPALQERAPFSVERSWEIQRVGAPTIAPDGSFAVVPISRTDMAADKSVADLWLLRTDGSQTRQLTSHPASEGSPLISPDGSRLVFVAQREGDKAPQLYLMELAGGEARRLTSVPTGVAQPKWFPDGRRIAFLSRIWIDLETFEDQGKRLQEREDAKSKAQVFENNIVTAWDVFVDDRQLHIFSTDIDGATPQPLTSGTGLELPRRSVPLESALYDIAPDGGEIAFTADSNPAANDTNIDVYTLAIGSKEARNRTADNPASDTQPLYSPDGRTLAFLRQKTLRFYADTRKLTLIDRASDARTTVAPDWDRSADGLVWANDSRSLFGAIDDAGTVRIYQLPVDGAPRAVTSESSFSGLALSSRNDTLVGLRQSFLEPPTLVRIDSRTGAATQLSKVNDALLAGSSLGTFESVTYPGAGGRPIQMWVNYPPGFDKSKKHPLFLLIHGGPHNAITNGMQFRWNAQVFGSWGFVTGWPNFHGSSGFGQEFTDSINPQQDELPYQDVLGAAKWFSQQPWIDSERMAAGGGSYGGYLTTILLGREHPFRALIAHAAVYNWYTQVGADYATEVGRFGGFWTENQSKVIAKGSPHFGAANFRTPTLVLHGQKDYRVPVNHGLELYHALIQRGVPTRFVYFPDENHWILKPNNSLLWYREVKSWLDRFVLEPSPKGK